MLKESSLLIRRCYSNERAIQEEMLDHLIHLFFVEIICPLILRFIFPLVLCPPASYLYFLLSCCS